MVTKSEKKQQRKLTRLLRGRSLAEKKWAIKLVGETGGYEEAISYLRGLPQ